MNRKRMLAFIICSILIVVSFTGCRSEGAPATPAVSSNGTANTEEGEFRIVTSFYPIYIAALNIVDGAKNIKLENLASPETGCLHDYQLKTSDMKKLEQADVFVANGAGMESFLDKVLKERSDLPLITATDGIELLESDDDHLGHEDHDHEDHDHDEEFNPHVWMNLDKYMQQVEIIADQLAVLNPENAQVYRTNAAAYNKKISDLKQEMTTQLSGMKAQNIVILHDAFAYFADEFHLNVVASVEVESEQGLSAKEIKALIETVKSSQANMLFAEKQYSGNVGKTIEAETGISSYVWDSCVTGDMNPDAYLNAMRENANILKEAFNID